MTKNLFTREITNWQTWGQVFQSIDAFRPLIQAILNNEGLPLGEVSSLTPGTNAVFRAGDYVLKIFVPRESGYDSQKDYAAELGAMEKAIAAGINTPRVVAASALQDKYLFRYIIMEFIPGVEAGTALKDFTLQQKTAFVGELKANLAKMKGIPLQGPYDEAALKGRALNNPRWQDYPEGVRRQLPGLIGEARFSPGVLVHGDITSDNVLLDPAGKLYIIDFADSTIAPAEYEYPCIIVDLFALDKDMFREFFAEMDYAQATQQLLSAILIHEYGAIIMRMAYERLAGKPIAKMKDLHEFRELLHNWFLD